MNQASRVYVAGCDNLIGMAIKMELVNKGYLHVFSDLIDLCDSKETDRFFEKNRPEYVFLAAAKMGGIQANIDYPADYMLRNLQIECNVIDSAYRFGVKKLLYLASSCIYPRNCKQPIKEEYFLTGELEKTNEYYALARIAGVRLCGAYNKQYGTNFVPCMLTNIYGPHDEFDLSKSHVIPALMIKFYQAKMHNESYVTIWGTGTPKREFLYITDLGASCLKIMQGYNCKSLINVGTGKDVTIAELAALIAKVVGFKGEVVFDSSKPDGTPRKLLDVSKLNNLGFKPSVLLEEGLCKMFEWYVRSLSDLQPKSEQVQLM